MISFSLTPKRHSAVTAKDPIARLMAGFTGFAVAATLILVTAIPVKADRSGDAACAPKVAAVCAVAVE